MPVVNIYIYNGKSIDTKVDESTSHSTGDKLYLINDEDKGVDRVTSNAPLIDDSDRELVVTKIDRNQHIDYSTNVNINYLEKPRRRRGELD